MKPKLYFILILLCGVWLGYNAQANSKKSLLDLYTPLRENEMDDLSKPNRSLSEMQVWVTDFNADIMTLNPILAKDKFARLQKNFTPAAFQSYLAALGTLPFAQNIRDGQVDLIGIVEDVPNLLSSGDVGGRYVWIYEINSLVSATRIHKGSGIPEKQQATIRYRMQITRDPSAPPPNHFIIDVWQTLPDPSQTKP